MKILLGSHGRLASGIKTSIEILMGESSTRNLTVIDAYIDSSNIDLQLKEFFDQVDEKDQVLMLSDLYGGSVNQKMYLYLNRKNTYLVSGVNLAFVLEICMLEQVDNEILERIIQQAREMQRVIYFDEIQEIGNDEEFF